MCKGLVESSSSSSIFFCCSWQIRVKQKSDPIQTSTRLLLKLGEVSSQINVSEVKQLRRLADRFCIFSLLKFDLWELGIPSGLRSHTQSIAVQGSTCLENQSFEIISIVLIHSFRSSTIEKWDILSWFSNTLVGLIFGCITQCARQSCRGVVSLFIALLEILSNLSIQKEI